MNFFQRLFKKKPKGDPDYPTEARKFPRALPKDLQIEIRKGGTFVMSSERIVVKNDRVVYSKSHFIDQVVFECKVNSDLIKNLFLILQKNEFDKIKIEQDLRLDFPSNYVLVSWGNSFISKGVSQTEQLHKEWENVYMNCKFYLLEAISGVLKDQIKKIKVETAEKLFTQNDSFNISCLDSLTYYYYSNIKISFLEDGSTKEEVCGPPDVIGYLPTFSEFTVGLAKRGKPRTECKIVFPEGRYDRITFYEENNELRWKLS